VLVYALASVPQNKPLDNVAEEISKSINQLQKEAFIISRGSLSDFEKIGNGMCIPVLFTMAVHSVPLPCGYTATA